MSNKSAVELHQEQILILNNISLMLTQLVNTLNVKSVEEAITVIPKVRKKPKKGKRHYGGNTLARPVVQINPDNGNILAQYGSLTDAAGDNLISISSVWRGAKYNKITCGSMWKYI